MSDFTYKEISASSMGLVVSNIPTITKAPMKYAKYDVPGKSGSVFIEQGYASYQKPIDIGLKDDANLDNIIAWLTGSGKLTLNNENGKYYDACIVEQIDFEYIDLFRKGTIIFEVQPYKHATSNPVQTFTSSITVNNDGNAECLPTITIYGSSGCTIKLDGVVVCMIASIDTSIVVDSQTHNCYRGITKLNRQKTGEYLKIPTGSHMIEVTGTAITSCELVVNKRWL